MQADSLQTLPTPEPASAEHSARCAQHIRDSIAAAGGSISFAEYMQHALYAPGLGYYTAGATKFGRDGDFVTAPEISPLFGRIVGRQCAQVLETLDGGDILEFGAGSGKLAVDVLQSLGALDALPTRYRILEVSPDLAERQQQKIREAVPDISDRVEWLSEMPAGLKGVVIANEVLDALPVERFVRRDDVRQQAVVTDGDSFQFVERDAPDYLVNAVEEIESDIGHRLTDGYTSEISSGTAPWVADIVDAMDTGAAFLFDYGLTRSEYYAPDRNAGWLRCHFRHRAHNDPLQLPGIQDITSWVDFSAVAAAADAAGADIAGYTSQAQFLLGGGLEAELLALDQLPVQERAELSAQVKLLTLPGEMGERFKCLGLTKGVELSLDAFKLHDRTHAL